MAKKPTLKDIPRVRQLIAEHFLKVAEHADVFAFAAELKGREDPAIIHMAIGQIKDMMNSLSYLMKDEPPKKLLAAKPKKPKQ